MTVLAKNEGDMRVGWEKCLSGAERGQWKRMQRRVGLVMHMKIELGNNLCGWQQ